MSENEMTGNLFFLTSREVEAAIPPAKPEARLVEKICNGDQEAFNELYRMFAPLVHGIILARVPRDEVEDIVQEVFISAYKNMHNIRDKNAVGAWLAMIARNSAAEFYRSRKATEELPETIEHRHTPNTEAREILDAIRALPEAYRETLVLRLVEGMTGQEISEQTGLTPLSVRVNLHRGMKLLRQKLGIEEG
jgi:RNA polymerase sigma-70 factor (ECF subfamily)